MQSHPVIVTLVAWLTLAGPDLTLAQVPTRGGDPELVVARWVHSKVIIDPAHVVLENHHLAADGRSLGAPRDSVLSARIATALGVPVATAGRRLVCGAASGCLPPPGQAVVAMGAPDVADDTTTVLVVLFHAATAAGRHDDHTEVYRVRLVKAGPRWVVAGATVTQP
jgi:hypothetical protein